ncbi:MAG: hypothetical protein ACP5HJ_00330 [Candidatus Micrarchaeia archaeon]
METVAINQRKEGSNIVDIRREIRLDSKNEILNKLKEKLREGNEKVEKVKNNFIKNFRSIKSNLLQNKTATFGFCIGTLAMVTGTIFIYSFTVTKQPFDLGAGIYEIIVGIEAFQISFLSLDLSKNTKREKEAK